MAVWSMILFFVAAAAVTNIDASRLTQLVINSDDTLCSPERLKTSTYVCFNNGTVVCVPGWQNFDPPELSDPCRKPVCSFGEGNDTEGCGENGECIYPGICACAVGWSGARCDQCVRLPGCEHGSCDGAFTCNCEPQYTGGKCNLPVCNNCVNGRCASPDLCQCFDGFSGPSCEICLPLPGCVNGGCEVVDGVPRASTCNCSAGFTGALCETPVCDPPCVHGSCVAGNPNRCICQLGYRGDSCSQCVPYGDCPVDSDSACIEPNQCFCPFGAADPLNVCNQTAINGP